jgi:hypothetical protein
MAGSRSEREVKVKFTGESSSVQSAASDVRKVFQMLDSDINDDRDAIQKLGAAYEQVADAVRKDSASMAQSVDVVSDALGPELTSALNASGRTVEDYIVEWRKLGLTFADIDSGSHELAAGLRRMDDAARNSMGSVGDGLKKIEDGSNRARSNMANFVGNAASELPLVSEAIGPLNVGIGQMVEGLAEGDINFKKFLATGGAMAGISVGLAYVNNQLDLMKQKDAFRTDQVKAFEEVIKESGDAIEGLVEHYRDLGKIQITTMANAGNPFADATKDITKDLIAAGLSVDQYARLIEGGTPAIQAWVDAQQAAGNAIDIDVLRALGQGVEDYTAASDRAATSAEFFATSAASLNETWDRGVGVLGQQSDATHNARIAQEALTRAQEAAEQQQRELTDAQLASIDAGYAAMSAQDSFAGAMDRLATATDDPTTSVNELDQAQRNAAQAALAMGLANQANAEQIAANAGAPLGAAASTKVLTDTLYMLAMSMDANSPVRAAILGHIDALGGVQPTVDTEFTVQDEQAITKFRGIKTKSDDAKIAAQDLKGAVDDLPGNVTIPFTFPGVGQIPTIIANLNQLTTAANRANAAVNRVVS